MSHIITIFKPSFHSGCEFCFPFFSSSFSLFVLFHSFFAVICVPSFVSMHALMYICVIVCDVCILFMHVIDAFLIECTHEYLQCQQSDAAAAGGEDGEGEDVDGDADDGTSTAPTFSSSLLLLPPPPPPFPSPLPSPPPPHIPPSHSTFSPHFCVYVCVLSRPMLGMLLCLYVFPHVFVVRSALDPALLAEIAAMGLSVSSVPTPAERQLFPLCLELYKQVRWVPLFLSTSRRAGRVGTQAGLG
jgi:hypothetical protein